MDISVWFTNTHYGNRIMISGNGDHEWLYTVKRVDGKLRQAACPDITDSSFRGMEQFSDMQIKLIPRVFQQFSVNFLSLVEWIKITWTQPTYKFLFALHFPSSILCLTFSLVCFPLSVLCCSSSILCFPLSEMCLHSSELCFPS
jgi:hypothetical protein